MSLKDLIANAPDLKEELVFVPEWDVSILLKEMIGTCVADLMTHIAPTLKGVKAKDVAKDDADITVAIEGMRYIPQVLRHCIYDPETREPIFDSADGERILARKSTAVLFRLFMKVADLSGLGEDMLQKAKSD